MNRLLARRAGSFLRRKLGIDESLFPSELLDRVLFVRDGCIRERADYDDAWLLACALRSEFVVDIGANIGQAALIILLSDRVREIILVEPNAGALADAAEVLIHNRLAGRARFVAAFAGENEGKMVDFWTVGTGAAGSIHKSHAVSASRRNCVLRVPTETIDHICERYDIVPDLIKIDVEGAESEVLIGSRITAQSGRTRFLVEMHSSHMSMEENTAQVLHWCRDSKYHAWYLSGHSLLTTPDAVRHRGRCHLLLQPAAWPYPDWLREIPQSADLSVALKQAGSN